MASHGFKVVQDFVHPQYGVALCYSTEASKLGRFKSLQVPAGFRGLGSPRTLQHIFWAYPNHPMMMIPFIWGPGYAQKVCWRVLERPRFCLPFSERSTSYFPLLVLTGINFTTGRFFIASQGSQADGRCPRFFACTTTP